MQDALLAFAGGVGILVAPWLASRAVDNSPTRLERNCYAVLGGAAIIASLYLIFSSIVGLLGLLVGAAIIYFSWKRNQPDFVVEERLLDDAVTPELAAKLEGLRAQARQDPEKDLD